MPQDKYTRKELEKIATGIIGETATLTPIGNHDLNRHLVYKVSTPSGKHFVFKYFYMSHYTSREMAALNYLKNENLPIPKIIDHGSLDDQRSWVLMDYLEGMPLFKIIRHIPYKNQMLLFKEMGQVLHHFHNLRFNSFGQWPTAMGAPGVSLKTAYHPKLDFLFDRCDKDNLPNKALLDQGMTYLGKHLDCLDTANSAVLCHLDFDARNILVKKEKGTYTVSAILDFEHSLPWDYAADFAQLYLKHFNDHPELEVAFFRGYDKTNITDPHFEARFKYHLMFNAVSACTWSYDIAPDFYEICLRTMKEILNHDN